MKLELDRKEVEAVLLAYAEQKWPGQFNKVEGAAYREIPGVMLTKAEPPEVTPLTKEQVVASMRAGPETVRAAA